MLVRFIVENFLSFKERQVFSMVAAKHTRHPDHVITLKGKRILKGSFLFGANASGKSNFIKSINYAKQIILFNLDMVDIDRKYFRLDSEYSNKPSMFQFDFFANNEYYSYGIAFSNKEKEILSEWLYRVDGENEECIFERETKNGKSFIKTGLKLDKDTKYRFRIYSEDLLRSKTFLRDISEKEIINTKQFKAFSDAWKWINGIFILIPDRHLTMEGIRKCASTLEIDHLLEALDTGIKSVIIKEETLDNVIGNLSPNVRPYILRDIKNGLRGNRGKVNFIIDGNNYLFEDKNGEIVASLQLNDHGNSEELFSFKEESDGTKKLFDLLPFVVGLPNISIVLIDEIDRSLHTKLLIQYVELFYEQNKDRHVQLIATLHDVNLMNLNIIRQDEIWFIRRDEYTGASDMYSLNKFQIRYDKKIIKDYLLGRFGSIPCFDQIDFIEKEDGSDE